MIFRQIDRARSYCMSRVLRTGNRLVPGLIPSAHGENHREASSLLERGRKYYNRKDYEKAEDYFRRSLLADTGYVRAHYFLGLVLYKRNDAEGAIGAWKRATELNPSDPSAAKAQSKLRYVGKHVSQTITELEDRLGKN